jgi:hypothetical protein
MTALVNVNIVTLVQRVKGRRFCPSSRRVINQQGRVSDLCLTFPGSANNGHDGRLEEDSSDNSAQRGGVVMQIIYTRAAVWAGTRVIYGCCCLETIPEL